MLGKTYRTYVNAHSFMGMVQILEIMKTVNEKTFIKMWNKSQVLIFPLKLLDNIVCLIQTENIYISFLS